MTYASNIVGIRVGNLTVIKQLGQGLTHVCQCDCGKIVLYSARLLEWGENSDKKDCGCGMSRPPKQIEKREPEYFIDDYIPPAIQTLNEAFDAAKVKIVIKRKQKS